MPESVCAPRIGELTERPRGLEARREEPHTNDLALLQAEVREVIDSGDTPTRKALLQ